MDECIITSIYFDGRFWVALIEKHIDGGLYIGRYVFGAEPSNPQLLYWMLYEFAGIPLYPAAPSVRIRLKKHTAGRNRKPSGAPGRSLGIFRAAQSAYLDGRRSERIQEKRADREALWQLKQIKRKAKKRH